MAGDTSAAGMEPDTAGFTDYLKSLPLYLLPHHLLSRLVLQATRWKSQWWKNALIGWFLALYDVDLDEALEPDAAAFDNFNAFFTRALRPEVRPVSSEPGSIVSPVDGTVSQAGLIRQGRIFQAKGKDFSLPELVGNDHETAALFDGGCFATLYLSPRDYHRVHIPVSGRLDRSIYIPGRLFSVAAHTTRTIPRLFARNERLVTVFETDAGPMAVILVGAIFVACIETVWQGIVTPPHGSRVETRRFPPDGPDEIRLDTGDELGRFNMGSTVILLFGPDSVAWEKSLRSDSTVRLGQPIGHRNQRPAG